MRGSGVGSGVGLGLGLGSSSGLSQDTDAHPCSAEAAHGSEDSEADWTGGVESRRQFLPHNSQSPKRNIESLRKHPPTSNHATTASGPKETARCF